MSCSTDSETDTLCPYLSQIQPWNGQGTYVNHLANHYALMAMNKGTIDHARHMTKLLKSDFPTLNILIKKRIKELQDANTSV
jgi:hypothetical protein